MAQRRLAISTEAAIDMAETHGWLLQPGSGKSAHKRYGALLHANRDLVRHPTRYRRLRDDENRDRRIMVVGGYRVLYAVMPDTGADRTAGDVTVLAVFGPGEP